MNKIKYLIKDRDILEDVGELNELGAAGWELVLLDDYSDNVIFKRKISAIQDENLDVEGDEGDIDDEENFDLDDFGDDFDDEDDDVEIEEPTEVKIFEDSNISVIFKGLEKGTFLFGGEAYSAKFLVENKSNHTIDISALNVTLNGFVIEKDVYIASDLPCKRKKIDFFNLQLSKLRDCSIYSIADIDDFELKIQYKVDGTNKEYTTKSIKINPFEI